MPRSLGPVTLTEVASPATPAAGRVEIYAKADGLPYSKADDGVERNVVTGDLTVTRIVAMTQAAYDALGTKDPTTLYVVT